MERLKPSSIIPQQAKEYFQKGIDSGIPARQQVYAQALANLIGTGDPVGRMIRAHESAEIVCLNRKTGMSVEEIVKKGPFEISKSNKLDLNYCHQVAKRYERRFG